MTRIPHASTEVRQAFQKLTHRSDVLTTGTAGQMLYGQGVGVLPEWGAAPTGDHGELDGLADDDHAQYHNDARGDARYFTEAEHINTSAGAADAGKPIKLDAAGVIDSTMLDIVETDEKVGIDSSATAGYLGAASNDGVLRTSTGLSYADGGDYVTLALSHLGIESLTDPGADRIMFWDDVGAAAITWLTVGTGLVIATTTLTTNDSEIDHDSLSNTHNLTTDIDHNTITNTHNLTTDIDHDQTANYDANKHIDHTAVSISTGSGLTGGGDISANRTFNLDINSLDVATIAAGDFIPFWDITVTATNKKITFANFEGTLDHGSISGLGDDDHTIYLLADGSRDLTGNLAVDSGITIDGRDISADGATLDTIQWLTVGTGLDLTGTTLTTNDSEIVHDNLSGFAANEHFLQTAITNVSTALATGLLKVTTGTGALSVITDNSANWNTAFGWGDHSVAGYISATLTQEEVEDYAGTLVANATGTHTGITITYQDATGDIDFVVDHDAATNFVADEHIAHTSVTLTAGSGITGGGDISASRTFALDINGLGADTIVASDTIAFYDDTGGANDKTTFANFEAALTHANLIGGHNLTTDIDHASIANTHNLTTDIDHGSIGGLADDDHSQYHNDARGDVRYYTETELDAGQLDNRYFTEAEHINTSAGAGDAGKPIKLDADGEIAANMLGKAAAGSDVKVAIDSGATAGYLGAAFNDGVLRTSTGLSYADGGDYVTLTTNDSEIVHDNLSGYDAAKHLTLPGTIANVLSDHDRAAHIGLELGANTLAVAYLSSDQTITKATTTTVELDTEVCDLGSDFDTANHKYVVPETGYYLIFLHVRYLSATAGTAIQVWAEDGGATVLAAMNHVAHGIGLDDVWLVHIVSLTASDEIYMKVYHDDSVNRDIKGSVQRTYMAFMRVA